ncbi:MAG: AAA-like domain-containing protein [Chloroflexota bacterium]
MAYDKLNLTNQTLGQYQMTEFIGQGGMATVYKAYQPSLGRHVAIKVLPPQLALDPDFQTRFIREAQSVARLSHPNILPIYDVGIDQDFSYFVMKYVPGQTLRHLLGNPLDLALVSHFISQIAGALDQAHEQGIVHRDVKPSNILIEDDWLLLADFGLAKSAVGQKELTGTGAIMGTPTYLSPEQAESKPIDHRADIYSLGIILYEMVTGQSPYQGDSPMAVMFKHIYEELPSPRKLNSKLSIGVEEIIRKATAKKPEDRYNRAGELADALRVQIHVSSVTSQIVTLPPSRFFIAYDQQLKPDCHLADYLTNYLTERGHEVFRLSHSLNQPPSNETFTQIEQQIKESKYFIALLSQDAMMNEMVQAELVRAYTYRKDQNQPQMITIRVNHDGDFPYAVDPYLDHRYQIAWHSEIDNERVGQEVIKSIVGPSSLPTLVPAMQPKTGRFIFSEDGGILEDSDSLHPPLPEFDPRLLEALEAPGGVVKLRDKFYIERHADAQLRREVIKSGTTTTIRASRQTGKSSLLVRGIHYAKQNGAKIVSLDLQRMDTDRLTAPELFLRDFAEQIVRKLRLDVSEIDNFWQGSLGAQDKLTYLMEDYILPEANAPIILALDEVDRLLQVPFHTDFFGLLRSWHNSRAMDELWDQLNLVMVISTEPYLLITDVNQSPFNVGLKIYLDDFDETQLRDLNQRHGSPVQERDLPSMINLLGGHPYLARKALYTMVTESLVWDDLVKSATLDHGIFGDHLRRHHWLLRDEPNLQTALKQVITKERCDDEMALFRLLQTGLIKGSGDAYTCRCDLYRVYFKDKL